MVLFLSNLPHQLRRGFVDGGGFAIRVFEVQIVIALLYFFDGHLPSMSVCFAVAPPFFDRQKFLVGDAAVFGVLFDAFRERELVVPDFFGCLP